MRFDIMTLFPDMVNTVLGESIIGRAQRSGVIEVHTHQIRDYSADKHRRVDDTPYGGGVGMVIAITKMAMVAIAFNTIFSVLVFIQY